MRPSPASFVIEHALLESPGQPAPGDMTAASLLAAPEQPPAILAIAPQAEDELAFALRVHATGYEIYAASSASDALELAEQMPLDVIVLDLDGHYATGRDSLMISGFRLLYLLRRAIGERPVALMIVTACDYAEVEGAVCAHADALVNKPVSPAQLMAQLRAALERVRSRCARGMALPQPWRPADGSGFGEG